MTEEIKATNVEVKDGRITGVLSHDLFYDHSVYKIYAEIEQRMAERRKVARRRKLVVWLGGPYLALIMLLLSFSRMSPVYAFWAGITVLAILLFLGKLIRED